MKDKFEINIDDTINSGQVFLWKKIDSKWYGVDGKKILILEDKLDVKSKDIHNFFRFNDDFQGIKKQLSKDKVMKKDIYETLAEAYENFKIDEDVITLEDTQDFHEEFGYLAYSIDENDLFEAEYRGRKVKLNKPMQGDVKKFKVYVKDPKTGNVKKVNFGHGGSSVKGKSMRIRKNNPKARKSFRARHNCDNPGPKTKARYWSCRKW